LFKKKTVLKWHLKLENESRLAILQGRLFQSFGATYQNALPPSVERILPLGISSIILWLDLSE